MNRQYDLIVLGAGAAGIFAARHAILKGQRVLIIEKRNTPLSKVRVSGGGRCNVTHACFNPKEFARNYPRGEKELIGPLTRFGAAQTIEWFASQGVQLKTEADGRMFPVTDSSQTIIDCLMQGIDEIAYQTTVTTLRKTDEGFQVNDFTSKRLLIATGSSPQGYAWAQQFGHTIIKPIPSLFTFNVPTSPLLAYSGIAINPICVKVGPYTQTGPILLTHFGFSGPAIIKLSAWAAPYLHERNYQAELEVDWLETPLPRRLRQQQPLPTHFKIEGKTTNKEEFVTCGGVHLKEIDFRTMESKLCPGLHFAGEILNIDGITGGFNFQNAWTTGFLSS